MKVFIALLLAGAGSFAARTVVAQVTQPPFSITISTEKPVVKAGSAVSIKITQKNTSDKDVSCTAVDMNELDVSYQYDVRDSTGSLVKKITAGHPELATSSVRLCTLKPGEKSIDRDNVISRIYDMGRPGRYSIQASRAISDNPKDGVVKSN